MTEQRRGQRWLTVWNVTNETIPAFGVMHLTIEVPRPDQQRAVYAVIKPDLFVQRRQDSSSLAINSEQPIPPNSYGQGTQDYPTRALVSPDTFNDDFPASGEFIGSDDQYASVRSYGPINDRWYLVEGGTAFGSLGRAWLGAENADQSKNHTIWVQSHPIPRIVRLTAATAHPLSAGIETVLPGECVPLRTLDDLYVNVNGGGVGTMQSGRGANLGSIVEPTEDRLGLKFKVGGLYQFGFSCTVTDVDQTSANALLTLALSINRSQTQWMIARVNSVGIILPDKTPTHTTEALSLTGLIAIDAGDEVRVENVCQYPMNVDFFRSWFLRISAD